MSEVLAPDTLEKLAGFTPLQRILLATAGTLQATLSAYFGAPVGIKLLQQTSPDPQENATGRFSRTVDLVLVGQDLRLQIGHDLATGGYVVCHAVSQIAIESSEIQQMVAAGVVGLGQILEGKGIRPTFVLVDVGQDLMKFWRTYDLCAPGVDYRITETFVKRLYE